ncbi:hypothetical protein JXA88_17125 [Candidatus Fermentibacteria bacterium]|nr:hypothetical protein [Candidatus Fermentibacteria bacterium]
MTRDSYAHSGAVILWLAAFLTGTSSPDPAQIAQRRFIIHDKGLQQLGMDNRGVLGNPDWLPLWLPNLEYPRDSGTTFLFSAGLWVGGIKDGVPIVSVCVDGDNGTHEFGGLEFGTLEDRANPAIGSIGWLGKSTDPLTILDQDAALIPGDNTPYGLNAAGQYIHYLGLGRYGIDDDGDGLIDEDPAGDISCDYQDNDGDGLADGDDPDFDGDLVPGSRDDDGDGLIDEDDCARAPREFITAYADTCETCVDNPDSDGISPLGVIVVQHSYQWDKPYADDFIIYECEIRSVSDHVLTDVAMGMFVDFHVSNPMIHEGSYDEITFFVDSLSLAVGADNDFDYGSLAARLVGFRMLEAPTTVPTYVNFDRLRGEDPADNDEKHALMTSGVIDPPSDVQGDWRFLLSVGPLGNLGPCESMNIVFAIVNGVEEQDLIDHAIYARNMWESGLLGPSAASSPLFALRPVNRGVEVLWANNAETSVDRFTGRPDFQGYNIWRTEDGQAWTLAASYDLPDTIGLNLGWPPPANEGSANENEYVYGYVDEGLMNGARLHYVVTAFDDGDNGDGINTEAWDAYHDGTGVLESDRSPALQQAVVPGAPAVVEGCVDSVYVVPNPYRGSSMLDRWGQDGRGMVEFRGLPPQCDITIYTLAGDLVRKLRHADGLSWEAWDLRNWHLREVAGGIYVYRVSSGKNEYIGRFLVIR